jgi:hypothetical protein
LEKGVPDTCSTTDSLNGYLVLRALQNVNNYFVTQNTVSNMAYSAFQLEIGAIRVALKPSHTQDRFKQPEPKKWLELGALLLGSIPEVGKYIAGAINFLGAIYIDEPLKNVDVDLANVENTWSKVIAGLNNRLETTFQTAVNKDPTANGGAIQILKNGAFVQCFSVRLCSFINSGFICKHR